MNFKLKTPCGDCPFLSKNADSYGEQRLAQFAERGAFHCHLTGTTRRGEFVMTKDSSLCAGMLVYNEKRKRYPVGMQLAERYGIYKPDELDMNADVI